MIKLLVKGDHLSLAHQAKREYEMSLERSAVPEPWSLIEQLSEEILEGVLQVFPTRSCHVPFSKLLRQVFR